MTTASSSVPQLSIEVPTSIQTPLGALVRDATTGKVRALADGAMVDPPADPLPPDFVAANLVPLRLGSPFGGLASAIVDMPDNPAGPLSIYIFQAPVNEVQQIVSGAKPPTSGTFDLAGPAGKSTLSFNATAAQVQTALDAAFLPGNAVASGGPLPLSPVQIAFQGVYANRAVAPPVLTTSKLVGGTVAMGSVTPGQPLYYLPGIGTARLAAAKSSGMPPQVILQINAVPVPPSTP